MFRRIIGAIVALIGLGTLVVAIGSATFWKPDETVTISTGSVSTPYVVTAPGVLDVVNEQVIITVEASDGQAPVVLAIAREPEVRAWLGESAHTQIDGLTSWEAFTTTEAEPTAVTEDPGEDGTDGTTEDGTDEPTEEPAESETDEETEPLTLDPRSSDLWIIEETGEGALTFEWTVPEGRWMALAATDGAEAAPNLSLTWDREVPTPLLIPGVIIGAFLLLVGLVLAYYAWRVRQESTATTDEVAVDSEPLPEDLDISGFTRRQVRELQQALVTTGEIPAHLKELAKSTPVGAGGQVDDGEDHTLDDVLVVPESVGQTPGARDLEEWIKAAPEDLDPVALYDPNAPIRAGDAAFEAPDTEPPSADSAGPGSVGSDSFGPDSAGSEDEPASEDSTHEDQDTLSSEAVAEEPQADDVSTPQSHAEKKPRWQRLWSRWTQGSSEKLSSVDPIDGDAAAGTPPNADGSDLHQEGNAVEQGAQTGAMNSRGGSDREALRGSSADSFSPYPPPIDEQKPNTQASDSTASTGAAQYQSRRSLRAASPQISAANWRQTWQQTMDNSAGSVKESSAKDDSAMNNDTTQGDTGQEAER